MKKLRYLTAIVLLACVCCVQAENDANIIEVVTDAPTDIFQITDKVTYKNPPKFGYNFNQGYKPDGSRWMNMYSPRIAMEPHRVAIEIFLNDVSLSTETKLSNGRIKMSGRGIKKLPAGYLLNGGTVVQFRREGNCYKQIHTSRIKDARIKTDRDGNYLEAEEEFIIRETPGPVPQYDDVLLLRTTYDKVPGLWDAFSGNANSDVWNGTKVLDYIGPEVMVKPYNRGAGVSRSWLKKITNDNSPYEGSTSCLMVRFSGIRLKSYQTKETLPFKQVDSSRAKKAYVNLATSFSPMGESLSGVKEITVRFWARQEHIQNDEVLMDLFNNTKKRKLLHVTDQWKLYNFTFNVEDIGTTGRASGLMFASIDAGRFYIDGLEILPKGRDADLSDIEDDLLSLDDDDFGSDLLLGGLDGRGAKTEKKKEIVMSSGDRAKNLKKRIGAMLGWTMELTREDGTVQFDYDSSTFCPEAGSTGSMKLLTTQIRSDGFEGVTFGGTGMGIDSSDAPPVGTTMKVEFWAKQEGLTDGEMIMKISPFIEKELKIGNDWKKYEFEFEITKASRLQSTFFVGWKGKGSLWMDNWLVYRKDLPPFGLLPKHVKLMKELNPGIMRIWGGLSSLNKLDGMMRINRRGASLQKYLQMAEAAGSDAVWIISKFFVPDDEIEAFMEFLGAPADVGYGKIRAEQGHPKPWTDVFKKIYIESGNESCFYFNEVQYAALSNRTFKRVKQSQYFNADQFKFVVNHIGVCQNVFPKWIPQLLKDCTDADYIDNCIYVGGADGVSTGPENLENAECKEDFYQHVLLNSEIAHAEKFEWLQAQIDEHLQKNPERKPLAIACYEGGPGASLGVTDKDAQKFAALVGNSMLIAVPTLDAFMRTLEFNGGYANQFHYGGGAMWCTHNNAREMIPRPSTLALTLRNEHCTGDLLHVKRESGKTINILPHPFTRVSNSGGIGHGKTKQRDNVPLVKCYAFGDNNTYSILLYNMSATEARNVQLKLPSKVHPQAEIRYLQSDDPLDGNTDEYNVKIQKKKIIDFSSDYTFALPPGAIYQINASRKK